jgi:hypothetical protein
VEPSARDRLPPVANGQLPKDGQTSQNDRERCGSEQVIRTASEVRVRQRPLQGLRSAEFLFGSSCSGGRVGEPFELLAFRQASISDWVGRINTSSDVDDVPKVAGDGRKTMLPEANSWRPIPRIDGLSAPPERVWSPADDGLGVQLLFRA